MTAILRAFSPVVDVPRQPMEGPSRWAPRAVAEEGAMGVPHQELGDETSGMSSPLRDINSLIDENERGRRQYFHSATAS